MQAAEFVLKESGFAKFTVGADNIEAKSRIDMIVAIGIVGDLKGHFVVRIDTLTASSFVKLLSGHLGMHGENPEDPQYRKAAFGEIANQIGGRAIALLSEIGLECMITPPTVITGKDVDSMLPEADDHMFFSVHGDFGAFKCALALKRIKTI
jgi:chemotaxis protein CheX